MIKMNIIIRLQPVSVQMCWYFPVLPSGVSLAAVAVSALCWTLMPTLTSTARLTRKGEKTLPPCSAAVVSDVFNPL